MTLSIWLDPAANESREKERIQTDVAVIGAGVIGAGAAYFLNQRGLKSVILEAGTVASGASGRNGGFVLRGIQSYYNLAVKRYGRDVAKQIYAFTEENQTLLRKYMNKANMPYEDSGSYVLASSLEELESLAESADLMAEDGFTVEYLKEDPLDRDFYGALSNPGDIALDPAKLTRGLIEESCARVLETQSVSRVQNDGTKLLVHSSNCIVECDKVVLAVNAYASLFDSFFADKVTPARGQILVTKPLRERILDRMCYANYGWEYFRQLPDNRLLLGGCRQHFLDQELGFADMVSKPVQAALENYLKDCFPDVAGVRIDYRFSGVMGFTADGLPLVGEMKKTPGLFFAVGCNGHGLSYGINMSKLLVEVALDGKDPEMFSADRAPMLVAAGALEKGP